MTDVFDSNFIKIVSFIASILGIIGFFFLPRLRTTVKNKIKGVKVGRDYIGSSTKATDIQNNSVKNELENSKIDRDFVGNKEDS